MSDSAYLVDSPMGSPKHFNSTDLSFLKHLWDSTAWASFGEGGVQVKSGIRFWKDRTWGRAVPALFLAALVMVVFAAWTPGGHYLVTGYRAHWREWVLIVAVGCAVAGCLLLVRRRQLSAASGVSHTSSDGTVPVSPGDNPRQSLSPWAWALLISALPVLTSVATLISTTVNIHSTDKSLQVTERQLIDTEYGQITDRYNTAVNYLGSDSGDARLGGIYALQHVMQDYPAYQPTVVAVLCAFVRGQGLRGSASSPDIQAALTVLGNRDPKKDGSAITDLSHVQASSMRLDSAYFPRADATGATLVDADLDHIDLSGASLTSARISGAGLDGADLSSADLVKADLSGTNSNGLDLTGADLSDAVLNGSVLAGASLTNASFSGASLSATVLAGDIANGAQFGTADLTHADLSGAALVGAYFVGAQIISGKLANADLRQADFTGADLYKASFPSAILASANLSYASLTGVTANDANLQRANLTGANLSAQAFGRSGHAVSPPDKAAIFEGAEFTYANLSDADLAGADFTQADLRGADLAGADLAGTILSGARLGGASWPHGLTPPKGWQRMPRSDRLQPAGHP